MGEATNESLRRGASDEHMQFYFGVTFAFTPCDTCFGRILGVYFDGDTYFTMRATVWPNMMQIIYDMSMLNV